MKMYEPVNWLCRGGRYRSHRPTGLP